MNFLSYHHDQQQPKTKQQHQVPPLTVPHNALVYGKPLSSSSVPSQQQLVFDPKILANTTQQGSLRTSPSSSSFNVPSSSLAQTRSSTPPLEASRLSSAFNLYSRPLNATAQPQTPSWRAELVEETMEDLLMEGYSRFRSIEEFNINMLLTNLSSNCIEVKQQNPLSTYQSLSSGLNKPSLTSDDPWLHQPQQVVTTPMPTSIENSSSDTNSFTQLLLGNNIPTSCSSLLSKPTPRVQLLPPAALPSHTGSNEIESTKVASSSSPPQNTKPKVTKTKEKKKRPTKSKKENSENDPTAPPKEKKRKSSQFSSSLINFQATKAKKDVQFHNYNPPNINTE